MRPPAPERLAFKNDTEQLEKLFDLYTKMAATKPCNAKPARKWAAAAGHP